MVPVKVARYKNGSCAPANIRSTKRCGVSLLAFATSMWEILADNTPRNSCPPNYMIAKPPEYMEPKTKLKALLHRIHTQVDTTFSGLGVIVWDGVSTIPILPMRSEQPRGIHDKTTFEVLMNISQEGGPFHDGFHVVDTALALIQVSVYFSPAISAQVETPVNGLRFGGRYLAAAFGSCLEGVICTGVVSKQYGPIVFEHGKVA